MRDLCATTSPVAIDLPREAQESLISVLPLLLVEVAGE
jgi:hypothetical protein